MVKTRLNFAVLLVLIVVTGLSRAAEFSGRVVGVADGDTLTVLTGHHQVKVRIADIDAPEAKQPFGTRSRQHLAALCHGKPVQVIDRGKDRYKRTIGRVMCAGVDAASAQVRAGMAWVFSRYAPASSPLYSLEAEARAARRGLWSDPHARAPWEWRQVTR